MKTLYLLAVTTALAAAFVTHPTDAQATDPRCGTTVAVTGELGALWRVPNPNCPPDRPMVIDLTGAHADRGYSAGVTGVTLKGGTFGKVGSTAPAFAVDGSHYVRLTGMSFIGSRNGVVFSRGDHYQVDDSDFDGLVSDGVDVNASPQVKITGNRFKNFRPNPGDHPDMVQAYSFKGQAPITDLVISGNLGTGNAQGFNNFGNVVPMSRVTVEGNVVASQWYHGITFYNVTDLIMRGNVVVTSPGAMQAGAVIRTWVQTNGSTGTICGNTVPSFPTGAGTTPC